MEKSSNVNGDEASAEWCQRRGADCFICGRIVAPVEELVIEQIAGDETNLAGLSRGGKEFMTDRPKL